MPDDLIQAIKTEIETNLGHSVSIKASIVLRKHGWDIKNGPMLTIKNNENREIDIVATKNTTLVKESWNMLVIECKKQDKPWIFFDQNRRNRNYLSITPNHMELTKSAIYNWIDENKVFEKHHYFDKKLSSYYYVGLTNPDKGPSKTIYHAIIQVVNALIFYWRQLDQARDLFFFIP